jgi:hypothetical protein
MLVSSEEAGISSNPLGARRRVQFVDGGQLDRMEERMSEKFKFMEDRFKTVEHGVATIERKVTDLTNRQIDMENQDMKAVEKLLLDCTQKR